MKTNTQIPFNTSNVINKTDKDIKYSFRDFESLSQLLENFSRTYYPDSYKDFSEASSGKMLMDISAYIGDVLSFYLDAQFRELFLDTAVEKKNLLALCKLLGYKPKGKCPSDVSLDAYVVVPALLDGATYIPDYNYCPIVSKGAQFASTTNEKIYFESDSDINFAASGTLDNREQIIYEYAPETGVPTYFLLKKVIKAKSGVTNTLTQTIDAPTRFLDIKIDIENVIDIVDIYDSDGNQWYEVDYLAQETIFKAIENNSTNDPVLSTDADEVPYLLKLLYVPRRFITERDENGFVHIKFGSGIAYNPDEELIANPWNVQLPLSGSQTFVSTAIDPSNFINSKTLGMAPYSTTLTIRYRTGGGSKTNVPSNTVTTIKDREFVLNTDGLAAVKVSSMYNSFAINNPNKAYGGRDEETLEELRNNASAFFAAQNRVVTIQDYIVRTYSMPSKFGSIAKVFALPAYSSTPNTPPNQYSYNPTSMGRGESLYDQNGANPLGINLYVLSYDIDGHLTTAANALKTNIKNYLSKFRIITDGVNIIDGNIINFGVQFKIFATGNKHDVIAKCTNRLINHFNVKNWSFNQPIDLSEINNILKITPGVSSVADIKIINLAGGNYSSNVYDINANLINNIIWPSKFVSIFECKFPTIDIYGQAL